MRIFITFCLALVAFAANAQTFTDDLRREKNGQGHVEVNQSAEIDRLVNNAEVPQTTVTTPQGLMSTTMPEQKDNSAANHTANPNAQTPPPVRPEAKDNVTERTEKPADKAPEKRVAPSTDYSPSENATVNTNKKIMRHSYKATGYRIQIYSGGNKRVDREKCEQISARVKAVYPDLPIYVHFYSPSWKCRAGNYTDISEAKAMLKQIRALGYNQACLVKGTVNIQY